MARALDYDALHEYLEEHAEDASAIANDYAMQSDHDNAERWRYRARAFRDMIDHIEAALSWGWRP